MDLCGYHLRCSNQGNSCPDCRHQNKDINADYLHDVLNVWPRGKEAAGMFEEEESAAVLSSSIRR